MHRQLNFSKRVARPCRLLPLLGVVAWLGCYDGEALVTNARSAALSTRLAEVDLGRYITTLPRDVTHDLSTDLDLHIFGAVPRYRVAAVRRQLKVEEYRLRHATITALRDTSPQELAEPGLSQLRARVERVVNDILDDAPVKAIGFYEMRLRRR